MKKLPINRPSGDPYKVIEGLLDTIKNQTDAIPANADVFIKLQQETSSVVRTSLKDWQSAYESAIDVETPDREDLLELFEQIEIDGHVTALIETIYNNMLANGFVINGSDGKQDIDATKLFERPWFSQFVSIALDSMFWGYSGVQFTGITDGTFSGSKSIPRKHILPLKEGIRYDTHSDDIDINFSDKTIEKWTAFLFPLLPADQYKLGKFNKVAKWFILKREVTNFWAIFNELFGIPFRVMKTDVNESTRFQNAITAMESMTSAAYSVIHEDDEIEFHNGVAGSNVDTFDRFIQTSNKEISKLIIGSTMVLEDGSSKSQGEVHERNTNAFILSYGKMIAEFINFIIIPKMANAEIAITTDHVFKWDTSQRLNRSQMADLIIKLRQSGYTIPIEFVVEHTGIPVEGGNTPITEPGETPPPELDNDGNTIPPEVQNVSLYKRLGNMYSKNIKHNFKKFLKIN